MQKTPGFGSVQIKPQLADLQFSEIKVPTLKGSIEAKYNVSDKNEQIYEIKLPKGMNGEFVLPNRKTKVLLNNRIIKNKKIVKLTEGVNTLHIQQ
ncbi:alpha-L-rhamnosidase C-terminal domain-containing protein [Marinifilum sp. RC60d5]|uniref:alpha-L-rhamnosidase C-terminal domain-containing protein n=1 Tax=Marinifilum sp. RC60d5 TaxID=3458414 RepID=UPI0040359F1D